MNSSEFGINLLPAKSRITFPPRPASFHGVELREMPEAAETADQEQVKVAATFPTSEPAA
jgi:hypothetical protein